MSQFPGGQPGFQYPMATGYPGQPGQFAQPQQPGQFAVMGQPMQQQQQQQQPQLGQQQYPQFTAGGIAPQATGFMPMRPQATGFVGAPAPGFGRGSPIPPPIPPIPQQFTQQQPAQYRAPPPPPPGQFLTPGGGAPSFLQSQPTGYGGARLGPQFTSAPMASPLVPQATGYIDPRLTLMSSTLLPSAPQTQQGFSLQQSFNQTNQSRGKPQMSWTITRAEKKNYDQIFRAWDPQSSGFVSGTTALEVFGQSGLGKDDLAKIWALADTDNRGKLNIAEFHVAMGLIYRKLNGQDIPEVLPAEMVPPSARDAEDAVNFLKGILKDDTHTRVTNTNVEPGGRVSYQPVRSFNDPQNGRGNSRDATLYTHEENKAYVSKNRHISRADVLTGEEDDEDEIQSLKRQLENSKKELDNAAAASASRSREDEALDREMDDLKRQIRSVRDDIDYVSRGPRSDAREDDRRRLERKLLHLTHERIPEVERKIEDRNRRREREKREWSSARDGRNERSGRYDGGRSSPGSGIRGSYDRYDDRDRDRDRGYGDRERDRDYGRDDYDRPRDSYRSRDDYDRPRDDYDRPRSRNERGHHDSRRDDDRNERDRPRTPTVQPPAERSKTPLDAPARGPTASPAPTKNMTPEEKAAFIRAEAQRRTQERMRALGLSVPGTAAPVDLSVENRLAQERKEAEEKARKGEEEAELREKMRQERLLQARGDTPAPPPEPKAAAIAPPPVLAPPVAVAAAPISTPAPVPPAPKKAPAPPPPKKRGMAPAPPSKSAAAAARPVVPAAPLPPPAPLAEPEETPDEKAFRERKERLARERAAFEEEERLFQEQQATRQAQRKASAVSTPIASPPTLASLPALASPPAVMSPPAVPAAGSPPTAKTNPFRLGGAAGTPGAAAVSPAPSTGGGSGSTNPFFRPQPAAAAAAAAPDTIAPPPAPPAPTPVAAPSTSAPAFSPPRAVIAPPAASKGYIHKAPKGDDNEDWGEEIDDDSDSSDDGFGTAGGRQAFATHLFNSIIPSTPAPPSRPTSTAPATGLSTATSPPPPPPAPPASAPPATFASPAADAPPPPPPPGPPPPPAPPAPVAPPAPAVGGSKPGGMNALLGDIQTGMRLRKTVTNDRSTAGVSGRVVGDSAPPAHVGIAIPQPPSPPPAPIALPAVVPPAPVSAPEVVEDEFYTPTTATRSENRQSVDWFGDMAASGIGRTAAAIPDFGTLPPTAEEDEDAPASSNGATNGTAVPDIRVDDGADDPMEDIDKTKNHSAFSLYAYEAQRSEELSFAPNVVLKVNPSKSGSDWWFGHNTATGASGLLPKTYINVVEAGVTTARALYDYTAQNPDELSLTEGDTLTVIEQSDPDWWKIEHQGHVRVVPALYLEAVQGRILHQLPRLDTEVIPDGAQNGSSSREVILRSPDAQNADSPSNVGRFSTSAALSPVVAGRPTRSALSSPSTSVSYLSSEAESDDESDDSAEEGQTDEQVRAERQTRELERKRVLEAAGLIVKPAPEAPPRPAKRRRAPAPPPRTSSSIPTTVPEDGLLEPEDDADDIPPPLPPKSPVTFQLDDAYERYQKYQLAQPGHNKRMSVSSVDVPPSPSGTTNSSLMLPSSGGESRYSSLFALFGRSKTPAGDDIAQAQKSRPVISGPISGPVTHLPSRENSPAFGSSWASLVDKSALEDMPKVERRRQEAIFELIATETAYVRDLQLIVENFCGSLMSMLDEKAVQVIFANIEDILITNTTFLSMLEERQKQSRLYIVSVGDIVEQQIALMGVYLKYCVNHSNAIKTLQALRASKLDLAVHLQQLRDLPDLRNLDLSSFLLIPMQRITRYPLLIKQIIAYTEPGNERLMLESSLRNAEEILESINESIREQENDQRLEALSKNLWIGQGRLDLTAPTRYMGSRKLLKEGELWKAKSRRKLLVILCNDIVVFIDETAKSLYRMPLPLSELRIGEVPGRRDDCAFQLFPVRPKAASETIALRASSARECQSWMKAMEGAILRAMRADNRATRLSVSSI